MPTYTKTITLTIISPEPNQGYEDDLFLKQFFQGSTIKYALSGWEIEGGETAMLFKSGDEIKLRCAIALQNKIVLECYSNHQMSMDNFLTDLRECYSGLKVDVNI